MPHKIWVAGEEVLAADWNDYVQEQVVAQFANASQRTQQLATPNEGQLCYLVDVQQVQQYTAGAWRVLNAGATGVLGTKVLAGAAGFNNSWYDQTAGGLAVTVGPNRRIRIDAEAHFYAVLGTFRHVNLRIVRVGGATLGQTNTMIGPSSSQDICAPTVFALDTPGAAGTYTYRVDASTDHNADIGHAGGGTSDLLVVSDVGPATPGPQ